MVLLPTFEVLIATNNPGKISEVEAALRSLPLKLRYLSEFPEISSVAEVGRTYQENAVLKALTYAKQTQVCALADDSGLEVDALGGGPGVLSARFAGERAEDIDRVEQLLLALSGLEPKARGARFVCCMALAGWQTPTDRKENRDPRLLTVTEASCAGTVACQGNGANGFGFDPVFVPAGYDATFAELPIEIKARISHRAKALAAIRDFLDPPPTRT